MGKKAVLYDPHTKRAFNIVMDKDGRITKWEPIDEKVSDDDEE